MRWRAPWGPGLLLVVGLTAFGCRRPAPDTCATCTASPTALCDQGACKPRLLERPDPYVEESVQDVAILPYEDVVAWPTSNVAAGRFAQSLLTGAGIPHQERGRRGWQDLGVPAPLAPRARRLLTRAVESGQPGRPATGSIPVDSPPHLAFKVLSGVR